MADKKITQLTDGGAPQSTDEFVVARGGDNFKLDFASLDQATLDQAVILAPASSTRNVIQPTAGAVIAAIVKAHASQSVDLTQWQTSGGVPLVTVGNTGTLSLLSSTDNFHYLLTSAFALPAATVPPMYIFVAPGNIPGEITSAYSVEAINALGDQIGDVTVDSSAGVQISPPLSLLYNPLAVRKKGAHELSDFTSYWWWISKDGYEASMALAEPASGLIKPGEVFSYFDATNGAAAFWRKGKTLDGTVVYAKAAMGATAPVPAPSTATYITQTPDGTLSAEQALSALATGLVKNTTTTGVLSIGAQGTDYYAPGGTDVAVADGGTGASTAATGLSNLGGVAKTLYDANTVLAADTDDTPAAVTMAASTILARLAAGNIKAASVAEIIALLQAYSVGGTDVAVTDGGTGSSTASGARTNLGLVIGTDVAAQGDVRFASHENGQAGVVAPTFWGWQFEGSAFSVNRCLLARFVPTKDLAITKIAFMVHAAGGAGNKIDVGIYSGDLATRLGSSGSVVTSPTMASAGVKEISLTGTVNLVAGTVYYAAIVPDTTAGQIAGAMINNNGTAGSESLFGTAIGKFETGIKDVGSGVLPTSITTPTPSSYQGPVLALRES